MNRKQTTIMMIGCIIGGILIGITSLTGNTTEAVPLEQVAEGETMTLYKNQVYVYSAKLNIEYYQFVRYGGYEIVGHGHGIYESPFFNMWIKTDGGCGRFYIQDRDIIDFGYEGQWRVVGITSSFVKFEKV